eukprot:CAMPEP_0170133794 /NCGR_PEP_ID=MMETSP0033_2-20121228/1544_1 /TAXON_ID=195969 /ORGANISM="Dolichomastix tenuilepis, Strain CCMP3274" /LENGTH=289 /DNA_ID=CAMNT_0010369321 /DNA_START=17 /DNA_END=886 /DNA_ORIENTATION=+
MPLLTVAGKLNDQTFQRCKKGAEIIAQNSDWEVKVLSLLPTDYEVYLETAMAYFAGTVVKQSHKSNVVAFVGAPGTPGCEYIGGMKQLQTFMRETFGYVDKTNKILYERMAKVHMRKVMAEKGHKFVYMDFSVDGVSSGKVIMELFTSEVPKTCSNFISLCKGTDKGTYKNTPIHRIVDGGWLQGGDIVDGSGLNGQSIYGQRFADECFAVKHNQAGIVGMANSGSHTNASQFYITLASLPYLDGKKVAFGRVIDGMRTLKMLKKLKTVNERPEALVTIADAGEFSLEA